MQQINLYQPIFRRQRKVFSAVTMVQLVAVIGIGLLALYAFGRWQVAALEQDVGKLEAQRAEAEARFQALSQELAARRNDAALQAQLEAETAEVETRRQLLAWLGERGDSRRPGLADHLSALAHQHRPGVWLTSVLITGGGEQLRLSGATRDPPALVRYLRRLGSEQAFRDAEFRTVRIERSEDDPTLARFVVASGVEEED